MEECLLVLEHNALSSEQRLMFIFGKVLWYLVLIRKLKIILQAWNKAIGGKSPLRVDCIVGAVVLDLE